MKPKFNVRLRAKTKLQTASYRDENNSSEKLLADATQ